MNASSAFGLKCPRCNISIDVIGTIGKDASLCPKCNGEMVPNETAKIIANAYCKNCNSTFGIINSDRCPNCGELF